jgi:hypothetical protein
LFAAAVSLARDHNVEGVMLYRLVYPLNTTGKGKKTEKQRNGIKIPQGM